MLPHLLHYSPTCEHAMDANNGPWWKTYMTNQLGM